MSFRVLGGILLISSCALGQTTFEANRNQWIAPGTYATPIQPLITTPSTAAENIATPSISLDPVFLTAGASNATAGNQAGASTFLSGQDLAATAQFATQAWYGPAVPVTQAPSETESTESFQPSTGFEFGIAQFDFNRGAGRVMTKPQWHAQRVYTEADVARVNDKNGTVRFKGKTERMD